MLIDRFKTRVWSIERKQYLPKDEHGLFIMDGRLKDSNKSVTVKVSIEEIIHSNGYGKKTIAEQCTGLKDKNGKLIYEGDIVRVDSRVYYIEALTLVVRVHNGAFMVGDRFIDNNSRFMKIIGNIHENPDLLEEI